MASFGDLTSPVLLACGLIVGTCQAASSEELIDALERQFVAEGPNAVNARLSERWDQEMVPLLKKASTCKPPYLALVSKLRATTNVTALQAYTTTLQTAMQSCPASVLRSLPEVEVNQVCSAADATDAFPNTPAVVILRKRIQVVTTVKAEGLKKKVQKCIASYQEELNALK